MTSYLTGCGTSVEGYTLKNFIIKPIAQASCLSLARQKFVDDMIEGGYTYWLSLDDDMTFPPDIVDRLLAHKKDIVAVNARHKVPDEIKGSLQDIKGGRLDSTGRTGLEEIGCMGGAIFLARVDSFKHIPKPHFQVLWLPEQNTYMGEDAHFAYLLKLNNIKMWCDHDTSQLVGHVGDFEYKFPKIEVAKKVEAA